MLTCIISQSVYQFINGLFIIRDLCEGPGIFTFGVHSRDVKSKMIHIMIAKAVSDPDIANFLA